MKRFVRVAHLTSALALAAVVATAPVAFAQDYVEPNVTTSSPGLLGGTVFQSTTSAGDIVVDSTYYAQPVATDVYLGGGATTVYSNPGYGADGPIPGTTSGSDVNTSYGAAIIIEY